LTEYPYELYEITQKMIKKACKPTLMDETKDWVFNQLKRGKKMTEYHEDLMKKDAEVRDSAEYLQLVATIKEIVKKEVEFLTKNNDSAKKDSVFPQSELGIETLFGSIKGIVDSVEAKQKNDHDFPYNCKACTEPEYEQREEEDEEEYELFSISEVGEMEERIKRLENVIERAYLALVGRNAEEKVDSYMDMVPVLIRDLQKKGK